MRNSKIHDHLEGRAESLSRCASPFICALPARHRPADRATMRELFRCRGAISGDRGYIASGAACKVITGHR